MSSLTPEVISAIRQLLNRVQIAGSEVPVFNRIMLSLAAYENEQRMKPVAVPDADAA
jgi:hypothetical protein